MKNFAYSRVTTAADALASIAQIPHARFLGGGTNLIDLMRENIEEPDALVDVTGLPFNRIEAHPDGSVSIGAAVKNTSVANDRQIRERFPFLAQAILFGASGQIRNMATVAGNIMQRTRCAYFYDHASNCNKRRPGSGCDAIEGFNRMHAILGASDRCVATHPSDMCVALSALDADIVVANRDGERRVPLNEFHRLPGDTPHIETNLKPGELITAVEIPALRFGWHSLYRKVRDRASYAFALISVAAALDTANGTISGARVALGGVAHKPWRAVRAEQALLGAPATAETFRTAAEAELADARGLSGNSFKIELAKRTIVEVLTELAVGPRSGRGAR